jgi:hypothetical protein
MIEVDVEEVIIELLRKMLHYPCLAHLARAIDYQGFSMLSGFPRAQIFHQLYIHKNSLVENVKTQKTASPVPILSSKDSIPRPHSVFDDCLADLTILP